jgi:hypothetical protein
MKRLSIIRGGVAMALMLGILVAVASSAEAIPSGQLGVYMRKGLSLERAQVALATQSQVESAELPLKLEAALGAGFAGMWFEPSTGKFCIGVVSSASRRAAERLVAQAGLAGVVSYVSVRSTWSQLISAKGEWSAKLEHLGWRQFSTGLTPSNNAVSVTLSSSVPEHERALLEREAAHYHVNVSITVVPPEELEVHHNNSQCEYKRGEIYAFCSKPIAAGVLITPNLTLTTYCTAGPLAILSNPATLAAELETLLITAGHCLEPAGREKWFTAPHPSKVLSEIGPRILFVNGLAGDYGDIEVVGTNWLEAGVTPALAQITHYQDNGLREALNVVGEAASVLGASFCKQGAKSGEQCGEITAVEQLVLFSSGEHTDGLTITNACAEKGDSGGPYATLPSGNSVRILGTEVGSPLQTCSGLFCATCKTEYEPIKTSLIGLGLTLLTTSNQTRHRATTARHPSFLTQSGQELLFSGTNPAGTTPTLRAKNLGVLGTVTCEKVLVDGFALPKSPLAHRISVVFEGKCEQNVSGFKSACTEPIVVKRALAELGLVLGNKTVGIYLSPSDGTTVVLAVTCGGITTTVEGSIVGEIPEINKKAENQYNSERSESEQVFEAEKGTEKQAITSIELLGAIMTGDELKVSGSSGGGASQETTVILTGDGKIEICTKEPQACP